MANNWKLCAFMAVIAFFISILFGLIGGVGFGTLVLRAFLGALLFGVIGFAADILLRRFIPELFSSSGDSDRELDVTVPGVNPHSSEDFAEEAGSAAYNEKSSDFADAGPGADDLVEEIEELPQFEAAPAAAQTASPQGGASDAGAKGAPGDEAVEDLDVLPDVEELNSSFANAGDDVTETGVITKTSSRKNEKAAALTADSSPALLAKALQTVIKRDGEG